ncbi:pheromone-degrading enzyme, partial [Planoprotostelium fungivorum]
HDTSAHTLAWAFYLISRHPEVEAKLLREIDALGDVELTALRLNGLKYLNLIIKETLRMYPPGPAISRNTNRKGKIGQYDINKDVGCSVHVLAMHYNEQYFPNPTRFDPERFNEENVKNIPPFQYIPFAKGERSCIGQKFALLEMKAVLVAFYRKFTFTPDPWASLKIDAMITLQPTAVRLIAKERILE